VGGQTPKRPQSSVRAGKWGGGERKTNVEKGGKKESRYRKIKKKEKLGGLSRPKSTE